MTDKPQDPFADLLNQVAQAETTLAQREGAAAEALARETRARLEATQTQVRTAVANVDQMNGWIEGLQLKDLVNDPDVAKNFQQVVEAYRDITVKDAPEEVKEGLPQLIKAVETLNRVEHSTAKETIDPKAIAAATTVAEKLWSDLKGRLQTMSTEVKAQQQQEGKAASPDALTSPIRTAKQVEQLTPKERARQRVRELLFGAELREIATLQEKLPAALKAQAELADMLKEEQQRSWSTQSDKLVALSYDTAKKANTLANSFPLPIKSTGSPSWQWSSGIQLHALKDLQELVDAIGKSIPTAEAFKTREGEYLQDQSICDLALDEMEQADGTVDWSSLPNDVDSLLRLVNESETGEWSVRDAARKKLESELSLQTHLKEVMKNPHALTFLANMLTFGSPRMAKPLTGAGNDDASYTRRNSIQTVLTQALDGGEASRVQLPGQLHFRTRGTDPLTDTVADLGSRYAAYLREREHLRDAATRIPDWAPEFAKKEEFFKQFPTKEAFINANLSTRWKQMVEQMAAREVVEKKPYTKELDSALKEAGWTLSEQRRLPVPPGVSSKTLEDFYDKALEKYSKVDFEASRELVTAPDGTLTAHTYHQAIELLAAARSGIQAVRRDQATAEAQAAQRGERVTSLEKESTGLRDEKAALQTSLAEVKRQLENVQGELRTVSSSLAERKREAEGLRAQLKEADTAAAELDKHLDTGVWMGAGRTSSKAALRKLRGHLQE